MFACANMTMMDLFFGSVNDGAFVILGCFVVLWSRGFDGVSGFRVVARNDVLPEVRSDAGGVVLRGFFFVILAVILEPRSGDRITRIRLSRNV